MAGFLGCRGSEDPRIDQADLLVLSQRRQIGLLSSCQSRLRPGTDARLSAPRLDRLIADPQLRGNLHDRTARLDQIDLTLPELRRITSRCHRTSPGP